MCPLTRHQPDADDPGEGLRAGLPLLPQGRLPAEDGRVQAARGVLQALHAHRRGEGARRHRLLRGEPRAGRRLRRARHGHPRDDLHPRGRAAVEDRGHAQLRRERRARAGCIRRRARRGGASAGRAGADIYPPLRRRARHGGTGDDRARDRRAAAGCGCRPRPDRRRRADRGCRERPAAAETRLPHHRRAGRRGGEHGRLPPRGAYPDASGGAHGRRRHSGQDARRKDVRHLPRSRRRGRDRRRGGDRQRDSHRARAAEAHGRGRGRGRRSRGDVRGAGSAGQDRLRAALRRQPRRDNARADHHARSCARGAHGGLFHGAARPAACPRGAAGDRVGAGGECPRGQPRAQ